MLQMLLCIKLLLLGLLFEQSLGNIEEAIVIRKEAVIGRNGQLSCNLTSDIREDRVSLVIWYKEGKTTPIYSYDARDTKVLEGGSHHGINSDGKYYFNTSRINPATFSIANLTAEDEGSYRCRVDFLRSPTKNTKLHLSVIIPPENLQILDELGKHIQHYILGPYNEGSHVNLTCISSGGRPQPKLTWWHNNQLLNNDIVTRLSDKRVRNVLQLRNIDRKNLLSSYTCQSSNNNLTDPITSSVMINLNLRPLSVKIVQNLKFMSTKQTYELRCEVRGSRPAPKISWWLGSTELTDTKESASKDENMSVSVLTYSPQIEDQGKYLSCHAENVLIPDSGMDDGFKLNLHHVPLISLEFGTNPVVEGNTVGEGADVYFECNIKANPTVYRVAWKHNEHDLHNNPLEGIIISNQSLVLQNVSRVRMGEYVCIASNSEGDGFSQVVQLNVLYVPVCRPGLPHTYQVDRGEIANIKCEVESNPLSFDFRWKFNTSNIDAMDVNASVEAKNVFNFKPQSEHDYGTVLCWGINSIGVQSEPCAFQIIPAGKPEMLANCTVANQTQHSFQISCTEAFSGASPLEFLAELRQAGEKFVMSSIAQRDPSFDLIGLTAGYEYEVNLYAVNSKGRSMPYTMTAYTLKSPEKHTDLALSVTTAIMQKREVLMMVAGSVVGIIVIALLITIVAKIRGGSNARGLEMKSMAAANHLPASAMPNDCNYGGHNMDQLQELEADKNPDIIPPHTTTLEEWQEAVAAAASKQQLHQQQQIYGSMHFRIPHQQAIAMHQQQQQLQPQPAAAYSTANANGMIIYSGATLARPHMNNNFKRIDSNGIFHNSTIQQFDLASPPPSLQQQFYIQQQQQQQQGTMQQPTLLIASCPGVYPSVPSPLTVTGLNTATLDRFQTPPSPSLFVSSSSTNPICSSSNEPRSILKSTIPETPYYEEHETMSSHETTF